MPIQFEEVTGEIVREPEPAPVPQAEAPTAQPLEDLTSPVEQALRLLDQRRARLCAD